MSYNQNQSVPGSPNPRIHAAITAQGALRFGKGDSQVKEIQLRLPPDIIPLGRGKFALVDGEDYRVLANRKWHLNNGYARRTKNEGGATRTVLMHREIIKPIADMDIDHINGDRLDNRRSNLRICTRGQNLMNTKKRGPFSSRYKGVHWNTADGCWKASIAAGGKRLSLGRFDSEEDAARAYNHAALKHHGEFARLNVIRCTKQDKKVELGE